MKSLKDVNLTRYSWDEPYKVEIGSHVIYTMRYSDDCHEDMGLKDLGSIYGRLALSIDGNADLMKPDMYAKHEELSAKIAKLDVITQRFKGDEYNAPELTVYGDLPGVLRLMISEGVLSAEEAVPFFEAIEADKLDLQRGAAASNATPASSDSLLTHNGQK